MHDQAYEAVKRMRPPAVKRVYEVGSLDINGSVRPLFADAEAYHGIDVTGGPCVDAVADGVTYVPPFEPDCIVCCEVLEHAPDAGGLVSQLASVLAPGGKLIITCAGPGRAPHSAIDGGRIHRGEYYRGVGLEELYVWLNKAGLTDIDAMSDVGVPGANLDGVRDDADIYASAYKPETVSIGKPSHATLSVVVGTAGHRASLEDTLDSIKAQQMPGDELIVVSAHPEVGLRAKPYGARFIELERPGKDWGDTERGIGMMAAKGDYVAFMDDDDTYTPDARQAIAKAIAEHPGAPLIFRLKFVHDGRILWDDKTLRLGNVGTPCLVAPNDKSKLGRWGKRPGKERGGDYDYIASMKWPWEDIVWVPHVIALIAEPPQ